VRLCKKQRIFLYAGLVFLVFLLYFVIPTTQYHPNCAGIRNPIYLKGPLRPEYRDHIEDLLTTDGTYYWKINGKIYLRRFDTLDRNYHFGDRYGLFSNTESKIILTLAMGYLAAGAIAAPPPALTAAIRATEDEYGIFDPDSLTNNIRQFEDCEVMRAGAIWTEKLDAETETKN